MSKRIVLVFYPKENEKAFIRAATQLAGKEWPGLSVHLRVAELHKADEVETVDVAGLIIPKHYDQLKADYLARDMKILEIRAATEAREHGPDRSLPPADEKDKVAMIPKMLRLPVAKIEALVAGIQSVDFLTAMWEYENAHKSRKSCLKILDTRLDFLR